MTLAVMGKQLAVLTWRVLFVIAIRIARSRSDLLVDASLLRLPQTPWLLHCPLFLPYMDFSESGSESQLGECLDSDVEISNGVRLLWVYSSHSAIQRQV